METLQATVTEKPRKKLEINLEGLRGFAALVVIIHHALKLEFSLDSAYTPNTNLINPLPAHPSVLLFFILSGYVIGLTNSKKLTTGTILPYLRKRFVRLYPIYFISLLITLFALTTHYKSSTILGHFFFLQNTVVPVIWENNPLWSLNYEVIYYLAFIPISLLSISPGRAWLGAVALGIICGTVVPLPLVSSYSFGFVFWVSGLWLAQSKNFSSQLSSRWLLFALMCIFLSHESLSPFPTAMLLLMSKVNLPFHFIDGRIPFSDLVIELPFCFYMFMRFTNRTSKITEACFFLYTILLFVYYLHVVHKYGFFSTQQYQGFYLLTPIIFWIIGVVLLVISKIKSLPSEDTFLPVFLLELGGISYGIYVVHFPIGMLLARIPYFSGSALSFSVRLALDLILVLLAGYFLEMKLQPWFKRKLSAPTK